MQIRHEVELAAAIIDSALPFIRGPKPQKQFLNDFWVHSKCRQQHWHNKLKHLSQLDDEQAAQQWANTQPLIEEILISEMPTRIWAAVASSHDRRNGLGDLEPIVCSVLTGHVEANHRALELLVKRESIATAGARELNRLRNRVERWTDLVLSLVMAEADSEDFAFDSKRAMDFFTDYQQQPAPHRSTLQPLQTQALCRAFRHSTNVCQNAEIHRKIATSILSCFPTSALDTPGFASLWLTRLELTAAKTQQLVNQLEAC